MTDETLRYNIVPVPVMTLRLSTDKFGRILLSSDIVKMYGFDGARDGQPNRVELGYVPEIAAITVRNAANPSNPEAANVDKRGYISARRFFRRTRIEQTSARYVFEAEQDGWLVFVREG